MTSTNLLVPQCRVFISYSHDSRSHCDLVLSLAQQLRRDGIAVELDQFHEEELLHWPRWCEEQMRGDNNDFVLCICTDEYKRRVEGKADADVGRGVFWEGTLIYNELYEAKGNQRFIPVMFDAADEANIPAALNHWTHFVLQNFDLSDDHSDYTQLYRLLTRQSKTIGAPLGPVIKLPALPPCDRLTDFSRLIEDVLAGVARVERTQAEHAKVLLKIEQTLAGYQRNALHQLRSPPEHFTGRLQLIEEIVEALREQTRQGAAVSLAAIDGMGGVGKTGLSIMVAYTLLPDFQDMQLFLELRTHSSRPVTAEEARDSVLLSANPESRLPDDDQLRWRLYRNLFYDRETGEQLRALMLLDDAASDEQVELLLPPAGCVLVTSRRQLQAGRSFHLNQLSRTEATTLLQAYVPRLRETEAGRLAELCGDVPVALRTAGGFLKEFRSKPVQEYLEELTHDRMLRLRNIQRPQEDVNLIFYHSYRNLTKPEGRAWLALAVLPADFDRSAGVAVIEAVNKQNRLMQLFHRKTPAAFELLDRLVQLNLLDYDEGSNRYTWHDLLRDFAGSHLKKRMAEAARIKHAEHFAVVALEADDLYERGGNDLAEGLALFDRERVHFEAAYNFLSSRPRCARCLVMLVAGAMHYIGQLRFHPRQRLLWLAAQADAARKVGDKRQESYALGNMGIAYDDLGQPRAAIEKYEAALVVYRDIKDIRNECYALGCLGIVYDGMGEFGRAMDYYQQCLVLAREINDGRGESFALNNLGSVQESLGNPHKAIELYNGALEIDRTIGDRRGEANVLGNLGNAYSDLGDWRKAVEYYEQDIAIASAIGDRRGVGGTLGNIGNAYCCLGSPDKAMEYFEQNLTIARETGDRRGEANALGNIGNVYMDLGDPQKALTYYEQNLEIAIQISDRRGESNALGNCGNAFSIMCGPEKALEYYEQNLQIAREIGDRRGEANALGNIGNAYADLGGWHKAVRYYEDNITLARETGDRRGEANAVGNLGNVHCNLGNVGKAIECYERSLAMAREIGDPRGEGNALGNLGGAYCSLGDARKAMGYYEHHLAIAREIGDRRGESNALGNIGNVHNDLGEPHKAKEFLEQSLVIAREIRDRRGEGNAVGNIGNLYISMGEAALAKQYHEQHLEIARGIGDRRGEGAALSNLGNAYAKLGDFTMAMKCFEESLAIAREIGDRRSEANTLGSIGNALYEQNEPQAALKYHEQQLTGARNIGDKRGEGDALGNIGKAYTKKGEPGKAIAYHLQHLNIARQIGDKQAEGTALFNVGDAKEALGLHEEAISLAQQALTLLVAIECPTDRIRGALSAWRNKYAPAQQAGGSATPAASGDIND